MSNSPKIFAADDIDREGLPAGSPALTPLHEFIHGDGYRWASLGVVDLDPPTTFPPDVAR